MLGLSQTLDPEARAFAAREGRLPGEEGAGPGAVTPNLAVVARREGRIVGVAEGWAREGVAYLAQLVVACDLRNEGIGSHVLAAFESAALELGSRRLATDALAGSSAEAFYRHRGWIEEGRRSPWRGGRDLVQLRRDR